jgi:hypothetical protein
MDLITMNQPIKTKIAAIKKAAPGNKIGAFSEAK